MSSSHPDFFSTFVSMKKLLLILLLITLKNISYASFPVMKNQQIELICEDHKTPVYANRQPIWGVLSFVSTVVGGLLYLTPYGLSGWILAILAIVFGAIGFKDKPNGLAIAGFIIGVLEVIMPIIIWIFFLA